ncbi:MAG: hypothetical protein EA376_11275 [Phycisphaeraceae bacterium]|nr:MAG: hypothetical protein EA376_11275 [Phycisphaeraceae bacterium]
MNTMTELLREALREAPSLRAVARTTGVEAASLVRFRDGRQSLMLDAADRLAGYFGITSRPPRRRKDG